MTTESKIEVKAEIITFPFIYLADDYHEFKDIADVISILVGKKVSHTEFSEEEYTKYVKSKNKLRFNGIKVTGRGAYYAAVFDVNS